MCFSEKQSYINTIILTLVGIYKWPNYRLSLSLFFLATKDLIQGLLYRYIKNKKINKNLTALSWIHICFQPLFVNLILSNFSKSHKKYWKYILIICFIYGIYTITLLEQFDIQNDPNCKGNYDFCSDKTLSYIGKYHVGYKFKLDKSKILFPLLYTILMFVPSLYKIL